MTGDDDRELRGRLLELKNGVGDRLECLRVVCRLLSGRNLSSEAKAAALGLLGVESELDDVPAPEVREIWNPESLERKDRAGREYLDREDAAIRGSCAVLLAELDLHGRENLD